MIHQADWLIPLDGPPLPGGWLLVESGRIAAVGPGTDLPAGTEVRRFPGRVLMPGLINAHCHLELTALRGKLPRRKSFPVWAGQLRAFTAAMESSNYRASARGGIDLLLRGGATTVVDVGNSGDSLEELARSPLRAFGLVEALGLDPARAATRFEQAEALTRRHPETPRFHAGVTPHAAYSCSPELLREVIRQTEKRGLPLTLHACESPEEMELFSSGSGALQDFCRAIFPGAPRHRGTTPLRWLDSLGLLPDGALIVHGNYLEAGDVALLARKKAAVAHCPSSHAFFRHGPFPFRELREAGIPVCLGTDSLASADSLSMLEQIRLFRKNFPEVPAEEALRLATVEAAKALGMGDTLGKLKPGYKADFIAVRPGPDAGANPLEAVFSDGTEVELAMVDGVEAFPGSA